MDNRISRFLITAILLLCSRRLCALDTGQQEIDLGQLWKAAIITDTQMPDRAKLITMLERIKQADPNIVIHTGDTDFDNPRKASAKAVAELLRTESGWREFHLAPGNHDMRRSRLKEPLRLAATIGGFNLKTGLHVERNTRFEARIAKYTPDTVWRPWNADVVDHLGWQAEPIVRYADWGRSAKSLRYVFERGGIRFIVCDWSYSSEQRRWLRDVITRPDDSSLSIILHHAHSIRKLSNYLEGFEGQHNVKLVLSGHDHRHHYYVRDGIAYITASGLARSGRDCDALVLEVFSDHVRLDRYVIPKGASLTDPINPRPIWTRKGDFTEYVRPKLPRQSIQYVKDPAPGAGVFYRQSE
ncbi:MAG: metallophosphoesterase family protein [Planctomycetota bacterium]